MSEPEQQIPLYQRLRDARRRAGITQSALARVVECQQSAISMMERGKMSALAKPTLMRIGETLGVPMPESLETVVAGGMRAVPGRRYCPVFDCPTNLPYVVSGALLFRPHLSAAGPGPYCAYCGELLESACPACGAAVGEGACCAVCGTGYIDTAGLELADPAGWADAQRKRVTSVLNLAGR